MFLPQMCEQLVENKAGRYSIRRHSILLRNTHSQFCLDAKRIGSALRSPLVVPNMGFTYVVEQSVISLIEPSFFVLHLLFLVMDKARIRNLA